MRSLVPLASMLVALAAAMPAAGQGEAQFSAWCFERASDQQKIEGCSAVIASGRESTDKLWQAHVNRGDSYAMSGDSRRAIADYGEALKLKAGNPVVLMTRCHEYAVAGDLQPALADCNESLRLQPGAPVALGTRGMVLLKLGRFDEAIADYDAGLKIYAKSPISLYGRGVARRRKGDVAGGDADIAAAKALQANVADVVARWGVSPP